MCTPGAALHSQVAMHRDYGGVVPELASRDHVRKLLPLIRQTLAEAGLAAEGQGSSRRAAEQQAAEAVDADTPMGALAARLYSRFVEEEDGKGKDFSAMLPRLAARGRGQG